MDDPLGYVVDKMAATPVEKLLATTEFLEELHLASVPGALSSQSFQHIKAFFSSDSTVGTMVRLLFDEPAILFTYKNAPTYFECARLYHLQNLMSNSPFAPSILDALLTEKSAGRDELVDQLSLFRPMAIMNAEALVRVCNALFDRTTVTTFVGLYRDERVELFRGILFQIGAECVKELALRFCDDLFCDPSDLTWEAVPYQLLQQIFPCTKLAFASFDIDSTSLEYKFPLMLYTCDFITDLIQENRPDTLGRYIVTQLTTHTTLAAALVDGVLVDLHTLPTALSCESYGMKILNSMLQLHHCGCISRHQTNQQDTAREIDCQGTLNALWSAFVARLPDFLHLLQIPPHRNFTLKHVQLLYLLYPVLRVSCIAVDEVLMQHRTFETLLALVDRFPNANILHTAVCRLFITCLEDCPVMFGQELQTRRSIHDPLRNSLLRESVLTTVIQGCGSQRVTCFKDIAMSFDELMMQSPPVPPELATRWNDFATTTLENIRADWALQLPTPNGCSNHLNTQAGPSLEETNEGSSEAKKLLKRVDTGKPSELSGPTLSTPGVELSSSPTKSKELSQSPLQALYDSEEQALIHQFTALPGVVR
ncbi:hypothetical protein LEN26_013734 [Aphanomyces euteiches]|nr:hypothetical protein AeMF1_020317 [Aphanomyces euteiches]KAH9110557.1 hypothetical protein LEN26_013734 [Aphanomyces euteiches]KAH9185582.1 hypothetical protein AeNC1_012441 [Aphanomyces euteiches]